MSWTTGCLSWNCRVEPKSGERRPGLKYDALTPEDIAGCLDGREIEDLKDGDELVFPDAATPWCLVGRRATVTYRNGEVKEGTITHYGVPDYAENLDPEYITENRLEGDFGHHTIKLDELSAGDVYFNASGVLSQYADADHLDGMYTHGPTRMALQLIATGVSQEEGARAEKSIGHRYRRQLRTREQGNDLHLVHSCGTVSVDFEGAVEYFKHFNDEGAIDYFKAFSDDATDLPGSWDMGGGRGVCFITGEQITLWIRQHR